MDNSLPSITDIRDRLNRVESAFFPPADTRSTKNVDEHQIQCALKYQYIIAGTSSDVSGKYQTKKGLVYALDVDGVDSLCFPVHTSMNKSGPTIRGPTIPYNRKFEPWAVELYEYFQDNDYPYRFSSDDKSSKRLYEAAVTYTFKDVKWTLKSTDLKSKLVYFTSDCLRLVRILELQSIYNFDTLDVLRYSGLDDDVLNMTGMQNEASNIANEFDLKTMKLHASSYIHKLCLPYRDLHR